MIPMSANEWKGPGTVIGADGVVIFVRHGGSYVRVHKLRLQKVTGVDGMVIPDKKNEDEHGNTEQVEIESNPDTDDNQVIKTKNIGNIVGKTVRYETEEGQIKARVVSRAGKVTGKNRDWERTETGLTWKSWTHLR
jgi:hypothetical protein